MNVYQRIFATYPTVVASDCGVLGQCGKAV